MMTKLLEGLHNLKLIISGIVQDVDTVNSSVQTKPSMSTEDIEEAMEDLYMDLQDAPGQHYDNQ